MARSAPRPCWKRLPTSLWLCAVAFLLAASPAPAAEPAPARNVPLQLEVTINGQPTQLIGEFFQLPDQRIAARVEELAALGIVLPASASRDPVALSDIAGLSYDYNVARQSINIAVPDRLRRLRLIDAGGDTAYAAPQRNFGAYVNYTATLRGSYSGDRDAGEIDGGTGSFDGHVFGRLGFLSQSGIVGTTVDKDADFIRLDTSWTYSDAETLSTWRAGDLITGGLAWTRPLRIGGLQMQRDFSLRPDLITMPLPSLSGSAALPSTLDVYVGNTKTYSTEIPSGPYRIDNIPVVSGAGTARLVLTDATGRQIQTESSFFTDIRLMRAGLFSYSLEAGFPRLDYGVDSFNYDDGPVVTGSLRGGLSDTVSVEGHIEAGHGLVNGGGGVVFATGRLGLLSVAGSASSVDGEQGSLLYGGWYLPLGNFSVQGTTQRSFGDYRDLASLPIRSGNVLLPGAEVPRAIDQLALGYRFDTGTSVSLAGIHVHGPEDRKSTIVTGSLNHSFDNGMSLFASAFRDFDEKGADGVFVGLSVPLGSSVNAFASVANDKLGTSFSADLQKSMGSEPGSWGGRLSVDRGAGDFVSGYGALRLRSGVFEGSFIEQDSTVSAYASFSGSIVAAGGGIFAAQRIDDAFAVVDAGAPGVKVLLENRPVGVTGDGGDLLVTGLRSYQNNTITIDPTDLPLDAEIPNVELRVVPAARSGALARFEIEQSVPAAEVIFTDAKGAFVEPGARGTLLGAVERFVVGYDGRAFIRNLKSENVVSIDLPAGTCEARFAYVARPNTRATIGPITCR
jgi:outer membrane usher protein